MTTASFLAFAILVVAPSLAHQPQLKHVSVVFRHGDRAPDAVELYPNDPYHDSIFYPVGIGGLTNKGKMREFNLGKMLRERYNDFLGDTYIPHDVYARSTDYKRTKMCLQLVLAALYPPKANQIWNKDLKWQPIPTLYETDKNDWLMIPEECPEYMREREKVERSPQIVKKLESLKELMSNLTKWTGKNITTSLDMFNLYHALTAESAMNLTLPEWTNEVFPYGLLLDGTNLWYETFSYNTVLRRLNGGKLLHSIVKDMKAIKDGRSEKSSKISIYSGHETNVVALSQAYGFYKPHVPEYSSAVITEFYEMNSHHYVKILYYLGIPTSTIVQRIPGCDVLCPFSKFLKLLNDVIPRSTELYCDKSKPIEDNSLFTNMV